MKAAILVLMVLVGAAFAGVEEALVLPLQAEETVGKVSIVSELDGVPQRMNLQGYLTDTSGEPIDDTIPMTFKIYRGGSVVWQETQSNRIVLDGLFSVSMGGGTPIPFSVFEPGMPCSLEVAVNSQVLPKVEITSVGFAYRSVRSDTAVYALSAPPSAFADSAGGARRVGGQTLAGLDSRYVNSSGDSMSGAIRIGGQLRVHDKAAIGSSSINPGAHAFVAGYQNQAQGDHSAVGGGRGNVVSGDESVIAGGWDNEVAGYFAAIAGGIRNSVSLDGGFIGGGMDNAAGGYDVVCGGEGNIATGGNSAVLGGYGNEALGTYSVVLGGSDCRADASANESLVFGSMARTSTPYAIVFYHDIGTTKLGVGVVNPTHRIDVAGGAYCNGTSWVNASSRKLKKDIAVLSEIELKGALHELASTDVVRFRYRADDSEEHVGLIAEDAPAAVTTPARDGINTADAIGWLVAVAKAQQMEIEELKATLKLQRQ